MAGAVTVVRGADAPVEELRYIYDNSDTREVVGEYFSGSCRSIVRLIVFSLGLIWLI